MASAPIRCLSVCIETGFECVSVYVCVCVYVRGKELRLQRQWGVCLYLHRERDRERDRETARVCMMKHHGFSANAMCDYDYIERQPERESLRVRVCMRAYTHICARAPVYACIHARADFLSLSICIEVRTHCACAPSTCLYV